MGGVEQLNPTVMYQWYKNETTLRNGNNQNITFNLLTENNSGNYKCMINMSSMYLSQHFTTKTSDIFKLRIPKSKFVINS